MKRRAFIAALGGAAAMALAFVGPVRAQDLMRYLDLTSPDMTSAAPKSRPRSLLTRPILRGKNFQASTYQGSTSRVSSSARHASTKPS